MKTSLLLLFALAISLPGQDTSTGRASWYGEAHRGKPMANGKAFNPDRLTAASWFYPLGTRVRVTLKPELNVLNPQPVRSVVVTITDRGPAKRLVRQGRVIDLTKTAFRQLADSDLGLVEVIVQPEQSMAAAACP
jgi:peptidoglycan lytic transglycosylase